jgi:hypothetical protein
MEHYQTSTRDTHLDVDSTSIPVALDSQPLCLIASCIRGEARKILLPVYQAKQYVLATSIWVQAEIKQRGRTGAKEEGKNLSAKRQVALQQLWLSRDAALDSFGFSTTAFKLL